MVLLEEMRRTQVAVWVTHQDEGVSEYPAMAMAVVAVGSHRDRDRPY